MARSKSLLEVSRRALLLGLLASAIHLPAYEEAEAWFPHGASSDVTPNPYRTTTQTLIPGSFNGAAAVLPSLGTEFSINVWGRFPASGSTDGYFFSLAAPGASSTGVTGDGTYPSLGLYFSGGRPATAPIKNRLSVWGIDGALNKISASTVTTGSGSTSGYGYQAEQWDNQSTSNWAVLYTVQVRSGNIEVWATRRTEAPRLLVQQAVTWTGIPGPINSQWGTNVATTSFQGLEVEQPTYFADRSLSQNEIAQIADGIFPENFGNMSNAFAQAVIRFANVTSGGSTASDAFTVATPTNGQTCTINGQVFTFKTTPVDPVLDIQIYPTTITTASIASSGSLVNATAHGLPNGRRVGFTGASLFSSSGIVTGLYYYVINATTNSFQISKTLGGSAVTINSNVSGITIMGTTETLGQLSDRVASFTPNTGGASNCTVALHTYDAILIKSRTSGSGGQSVTFNTTATAKMPANKRLSTVAILITDYTGYRDALYGNVGVFRSRANAWIVPTLGELAPNTQVTGSCRVTSWVNGCIVQRQNDNLGHFGLTGIYTGVTPGGVQVKITDLDDNTIVQDWTSVSSFSTGAGNTWSGKLTVPCHKRHLGMQTRKAGSSQVTERSQVWFGVGEVMVMQGDSINSLFASIGTGTVVSSGFFSRWSGGGSGISPSGYWGTIDPNAPAQTGAGETTLGNLFATADCCIGLINMAVGGSTLQTFTTTANAQAVTAGLAWLTLTDRSVCAAGAGWYLWNQGPANAGTTGYGALMDSLYSWLRTNFGNDIIFGETFQSNRQPNTVDSTIGINGLRNQQNVWVNGKSSDPLVVSMKDDHYFWSNTGDGAHYGDPTDAELSSEMFFLSIQHYRGISAYNGLGPTPVSAARSGAVVTVTYNLNGATGLQTWQAGNVTGFDVVKASTGFVPNFVQNGATVSTSASTISWGTNTTSNGDKVMVASTTNTNPGGIVAGTVYYVVNKSGTAIQLAATPGGAPITITSTGSALYIMGVNNLLDISSVAITGSNTVQITLAADPGGPVEVNYLWGLPGRKTNDPAVSLGTSGADAMTQATAQTNIIFDNYPMTTASTHLPGRPSRTTTVAPLTTPT